MVRKLRAQLERVAAQKRFRIADENTLRHVLKADPSKLLANCGADAACIASLGAKANAALVLTSQAAALGQGVQVFFTVIDTARGTVARSAFVSLPNEAALKQASAQLAELFTTVAPPPAAAPASGALALAPDASDLLAPPAPKRAAETMDDLPPLPVPPPKAAPGSDQSVAAAPQLDPLPPLPGTSAIAAAQPDGRAPAGDGVSGPRVGSRAPDLGLHSSGPRNPGNPAPGGKTEAVVAFAPAFANRPQTSSWGGLGITGLTLSALGSAAAGFGGYLGYSASSLKQHYDRTSLTQTEAYSRVNAINDRSRLANNMLIGGAAGLVTGLGVLLVRSLLSDSTPEIHVDANAAGMELGVAGW